MDLTQATLALAFKKAFFYAVRDLMAADPGTKDALVSFGAPGTFEPHDIISINRLESAQEKATMSTNRSREETITLTVIISCFRGGGEEAELEASERCYELLRKIEHQVRMEDTTVGGTVRECFLTSHESDGMTPEDIMAAGRVIDVNATFTARARVRA